MKKYSEKEALTEIFYNNTIPLSSNMLVYKHRYSQNKLSQKAINQILTDNNFVVIQPTLYQKI